jgi:hypothetical protein
VSIGEALGLGGELVEIGSGYLVVGVMGLNVTHAEVVREDDDDIGSAAMAEEIGCE